MKKIYLFLFCVFAQNVAGSKSTELYNNMHDLSDPGSISGNANTLNSDTTLEINMQSHAVPVIQLRGEERVNKNNVEMRWQIFTE